jgi:hypothetical protein
VGPPRGLILSVSDGSERMPASPRQGSQRRSPARRDNPLLVDRVDAEADDMSIAADPEAVLEAFKDAQGEAAAELDAGETSAETIHPVGG